MTDKKFSDEFESALHDIQTENVLSQEYRRKKTIIWAIRTLVAIALYTVFWKHEWVRWSLMIYVPLNILGLLSIFGWNRLLNKKIGKTRQKIAEAEKIIAKPKDEQ